MHGYKGMKEDMTCRGMQYEIGKTYRIDGELKLCRNGLHFCEKLVDVFDFYGNRDGNKFFEVDASGTIISDGIKSVASELRIVRELSEIEVKRCIYGHGNGYGYGYGNSHGDGYGDGYGNGYGDGDGRGNGYGYGDGYGNGNGYGNIYGDGYGDGYGDDISRICYFID